MAEVMTVTALNRYVKALLDGDDALFDLALRGEVANFVQNVRSGHCYFTLRDETCSVKAVMFRREAQNLAFRPEEGMRVVVRCRVTLRNALPTTRPSVCAASVTSAPTWPQPSCVSSSWCVLMSAGSSAVTRSLSVIP